MSSLQTCKREKPITRYLKILIKRNYFGEFVKEIADKCLISRKPSINCRYVTVITFSHNYEINYFLYGKIRLSYACHSNSYEHFCFFFLEGCLILKMYSYYMDILTKNILDNVIHRFKTSWIINRTFYKTYMYHGVCFWFILSKLKTV